MQILDSAWLIKMLKKSGKTPRARLLGIFDVLADWTDAPNSRAALMADSGHGDIPSHLLNFLEEEAKACGAQMPEALAQQVYFIALGALQEALHSSHQNDFIHAKQAASALIAAQTEKLPKRSRQILYGLAATFFVGVIISSVIIYQNQQWTTDQTFDAAIAAMTSPSEIDEQTEPSPKQAAEMYALAEQMRHGDCRYVEALQIPDADKKVYIESVVGGKVPTNAKDMALAQSYLQKINCSYTPMLMKNSVN